MAVEIAPTGGSRTGLLANDSPEPRRHSRLKDSPVPAGHWLPRSLQLDSMKSSMTALRVHLSSRPDRPLQAVVSPRLFRLLFQTYSERHQYPPWSLLIWSLLRSLCARYLRAQITAKAKTGKLKTQERIGITMGLASKDRNAT